MKITEETTYFCQLDNGDVFVIPGDCLYFMKTTCASKNDEIFDCVALHDGSLAYMSNSQRVIKVNCELIIH